MSQVQPSLFDPPPPKDGRVPVLNYKREFCELCKREKCIFWRGRAWCIHCEERELFGEDGR